MTAHLHPKVVINSSDRWFLFLFGWTLLVGSFLHVLTATGIWPEKAPYWIGVYFDSLILFDFFGGVGLLVGLSKRTRQSIQFNWWPLRYTLYLCVWICASNAVASGYMIYLDVLENYGSGFSVELRIVDLVIVVIGLVRSVKILRQNHDGF
ncbi:hypothetical protein C9374_002853 [Naegleria lovaniensis]|uniref:Uncharacterized protein n=1 Tax=Naegleria lovaniensis TaxID=51637 RepID=A0AA88GPD4_NAELO|nr:uncharacterized protein C9374_002853 [Naegleria lovaniensis]KAG2386407.1 hypothetical protein C9374_002853 [Naegleria lovaniensis]